MYSLAIAMWFSRSHKVEVMYLVRNGQFETGKLMRWIVLSAALLVLLMTGLETTHAHSDAAASRNSAPCAICITAHANAPAVTVHFLPQLYAVETVAVAYAPEGKSAAPELQLFIRPPPSV